MGKKTDSPDQQLTKERVAYHEAGHAVIVYLMGRRVLNIQIFPHIVHGYNGNVIDDSDDNLSSLEDIKKTIRVLYGGVIAESIKYSSSDAKTSGIGLTDKGRIAKLLENEDIEEQKEFLKEETKRLLTKNWQIVEDLAEVLIQNRDGCSLKEDDVLSIINSKL